MCLSASLAITDGRRTPAVPGIEARFAIMPAWLHDATISGAAVRLMPYCCDSGIPRVRRRRQPGLEAFSFWLSMAGLTFLATHMRWNGSLRPQEHQDRDRQKDREKKKESKNGYQNFPKRPAAEHHV